MTTQNSTSVINVDCQTAKDFFLKSESYCRLDIPSYFRFNSILKSVNELYIAENSKSKITIDANIFKKLTKISDANYSIFANKDSNYSWRKFQLIHPLLYVHLVHTITEEENWLKLQSRFNKFIADEKIRCYSVPVISQTDSSDTEEQIISWYNNIEQNSIKLAMEFEYLFDTDIADCYGSIYTHSIAWAVEKKSEAKLNHKITLLGNHIDKIIQKMQYNQTNGIPQGSVLIDFVAEILLGYIDKNLSEALEKEGITDFKILRYRDDYRVFVNNFSDGNRILKKLSEVLLDVGLHLNANKTRSSDDIITHAIKPDKLAWAKIDKPRHNKQKFLFNLREHAKEFPNSGTLKKELKRFYSSVKDDLKEQDDSKILISIISDIMYRNPSVYSIGFAIISLLLAKIETNEDKIKIVNLIDKKFEGLPNTGIMQVWFQRMLIGMNSQISIDFTEKLCNLVVPHITWGGSSNKGVWNNSWIDNEDIVQAIEGNSIFQFLRYMSLDPIIQLNEVSFFEYNDVDEDAENTVEEAQVENLSPTND